MRVWYALMATFLLFMAALVILLGSLDHLKENHRITRTQMNGTAIAQGSHHGGQDILPSPWQLEFITTRSNGERSRVSIPDDSLQRAD
jgi:high-affinity Fe2+/Pb2+ permease